MAPLELPDDAPTAPDGADREWLLDALAELIERRGPAGFLAPPIAPGPAAFPEPWRPTRAGVAVVARRCAAHAGLDGVRIDVIDARPTPRVEPKEATDLEVDEVGPDHATLSLHLLGADDVAGTTCHAIGVVIAATARLGADGPFRGTQVLGADEDTRRRGAAAAICAGFGVLAVNAAYQQYSFGTPINGYARVDYRVIRAGAVPMSALAFLVAVQAEVRGADLPGGLKGPQRDEARAWRRALAGRRDALRARLGIDLDAPTPDDRPPLGTVEDEPEDAEDEPVRIVGHGVFLVPGDAAGFGTMLGMLGGAIAIGVASFWHPLGLALGAAIGGLGGYVAGKRRVHDRCADCDVAVGAGAKRCPRCDGVLGRRIRHRNDRLAEAEKDAGESGTALPSASAGP